MTNPVNQIRLVCDYSASVSLSIQDYKCLHVLVNTQTHRHARETDKHTDRQLLTGYIPLAQLVS